ncbi:hypothetical protein [Nonomuraea basaltis]|uniref:hypothetical protein n=1 Tax=Nonomuraea basaltis TaxID=2495887 RepID=UPI003B846DDE
MSGYTTVPYTIAYANELVDDPIYFEWHNHQQYLHRNKNGYCGIGGTGVACPVGLTSGEA